MDPASAGTPPLTIGDHPEGSHASGSGPGKPPMPYARVAWDHLGQMATPARPDIRRSLRLPTDLARSSDRRVVAGVCGGLGHSLGVDANVLRLAADVLTIATRTEGRRGGEEWVSTVRYRWAQEPYNKKIKKEHNKND